MSQRSDEAPWLTDPPQKYRDEQRPVRKSVKPSSDTYQGTDGPQLKESVRMPGQLPDPERPADGPKVGPDGHIHPEGKTGWWSKSPGGDPRPPLARALFRLREATSAAYGRLLSGEYPGQDFGMAPGHLTALAHKVEAELALLKRVAPPQIGLVGRYVWVVSDKPVWSGRVLGVDPAEETYLVVGIDVRSMRPENDLQPAAFMPGDIVGIVSEEYLAVVFALGEEPGSYQLVDMLTRGRARRRTSTASDHGPGSPHLLAEAQYAEAAALRDSMRYLQAMQLGAHRLPQDQADD